MSTLTRILAALLFATLTVGPVSAATVLHGANVVAQATGSVQGTATSSEGAPISDASVSLVGPQTYTATTDANGAFTIANVVPGIYRLTVEKPGYQTAENDVAIVAGAPEIVSVSMPVATFTTLRTIARVAVRGHGVFNTSTASVNTLTSQQFEEQGQYSVNHTLDQIPGLQISYPTSSANGASAGSIVVPNIRGGLSYETATLIDGHPLAVVDYGDYVTTFLNSYLFSNVDVIKGPGAMSPQTNYAIGGTLNFRTKDPTLAFTPDYGFGYISDGGTYYHFGLSDTVLNGRLGFVVEVAGVNDPGLMHNQRTYFNVGPGPNGVIGWNGTTGNVANYNDSRQYLGNTETAPFSSQGLVACCYTYNGYFNQYAELLKAQYHLSDYTRATVTYFVTESYADQNANTASTLQPNVFLPASGHGYSGPLAPGTHFWGPSGGPYPGSTGGTEGEVNSEPVVQAEIQSTIGDNTILARYYHANVNRLINGGSDSPYVPVVQDYTYYGVNHESSNYTTYNGVSEPTAFFSYYRQFELDKLNGYSFEFTHPYGEGNEFTLSAESTNYQTNGVGSLSGCAPGSNALGQFTGLACPGLDPYPGLGAPSTTVPGGSSQIMNTYMLRNILNINPKLQWIVSLYDNTYHNTFAGECLFTSGWYGQTITNLNGPGASCSPYGNNVLWTTTNQSHFDERTALEWRPDPNLAVRLSAGSSIAPEYLAELTRPLGYPSCGFFGCNGAVTVNIPNANLHPETSWGYDLGSDYRLADGDTVASVDLYVTNLFNHFITSVFGSGLTCTNTSYPGSNCGVTPVPIYYSQNQNVSNSRFEGVEVGLKHVPSKGFGFDLAASLEHAYAYNLAPNFYCAPVPGHPTAPCVPANYNTNLNIIAGGQFEGNASFAGSYYCGTYQAPHYHNLAFPFNCSDSPNGFSNTNIPFLTGHAELNWSAPSGWRAVLGSTFLGKNNSFNAPPFWITYASLRVPLNHALSLQVSGDNIFNALPGYYEYVGTGVNYGLANGQQAASIENQLGPAVWHVELTKTFGGP
ncbi:MAG TPA: TonB-dependent receptor [Candidatus Dormibacteraeota bacterium]|nr:TonB-dependent receptor [Candidatus Dormibacteraeota bacterium]